MSLQYKQGNIIDALKRGEIDFLMHQVNCEGEMGAGLAMSIKHHFPNTEKEYLEWLDLCEATNTEFGSARITSDKIINVYSQYYKGRPNNRLFKYGKFETVDSFSNRLAALQNKVDLYGKGIGEKIGIPLIASGLAADKAKKERFVKNPFSTDSADMEYFKYYIAPIFEPYDNFICYYL